MQCGLDRGVEAMELALEQVAKEMVVAVPLAPPVERNEKEVRGFDLVEPLCRIGALEDGVAHASRQAIEHRRSDHEVTKAVGERTQRFVVQIVGYYAIVTGEPLGGGRGIRRLAQGDRSQVKSGRPAFGSENERLERGPVDLHLCLAQQRFRLMLRHGELFDTDAEEPAVREHARERERRIAPARQHEVRTVRHVAGEDFDQLDRARVVDEMDVVEHEQERERPVGEDVAEPGEADAREVGLRHCQRGERLPVQWFDRVERERDVREERRRVVVLLGDREPRERPLGRRCHLADEGRLPVPRRRDDQRDRRVALLELPRKLRSRHDTGT